MLFNSYEFIVAFLPIALIGFFLCSTKLNREVAIVWLVAASLFYYGWWDPRYLVLIIISMLFNFLMGRLLIHLAHGSSSTSNIVFGFGIAVNVALLAYFKYAGFFVYNVNEALAWSLSVPEIVLHLAISFFTFQQIVRPRKGASRFGTSPPSTGSPPKRSMPSPSREKRWRGSGSRPTTAANDVMLANIFRRHCPEGEQVEPYGTKISGSNINAHLRRLRAQRGAFANTHPDVVTRLRRLAGELPGMTSTERTKM